MMHLIEKNNEILPTVMIDAHVHIYSCFNLQIFFDSALNNFRSEAAKNGHSDNFIAFLILTDWAAENWFKYLASYADGENYTKSKIIRNWTLHNTNENCSLYARHHKDGGFYVIAGRKIITKENLEVLALISESRFKNGLTLDKTILSIKESGGIPVIPWAAGKWLGRRGKILKEILEVTNKPEYFLCDNGNRPIFWPRPYHFKLAESRGIRVLSGSDPLHFTSEVNRPGSSGFIAQGSITSGEPAKDLRNILLDRKTKFKLYGNLEHPYRFFRNQLAMQILQKKWKKGIER
jgi:hypothetical protein